MIIGANTTDKTISSLEKDILLDGGTIRWYFLLLRQQAKFHGKDAVYLSSRANKPKHPAGVTVLKKLAQP